MPPHNLYSEGSYPRLAGTVLWNRAPQDILPRRLAALL